MLELPGHTTDVRAQRVLVLAPHYDDEVLGCGGLLCKLLDTGSEVQVLFLSDSAGGVEAVDDALADAVTDTAADALVDVDAYLRTRRAEAEQVGGLLGLAGLEHLDLPDGELRHHLPALQQGIRAALERHRPELLLVTSPLEITGDHQAAFAAVHQLLAGLRSGAGGLVNRNDQAEEAAVPEAVLHEIASQLEILAYDVNHPLHPNLLVDVSGQQDKLRQAMELYASQQARHDYLGACLGLQRYRALSLGPKIEGAEGYVRLTLDDFVTRSPAQLIEHLGGVPRLHEVHEGPSITVIVRTHNRPALLAEALDSLARSTYSNVEVLVVNDGGEPPELPEDFPLPLRLLDLSPNRGRAEAAAAGVEAATGDYVTFLDDDDLAAPEHLATLAQLVQAAGVRVAYTDAAVAIYKLQADGKLPDAAKGEVGWRCTERRLPYSRDFDADLLRLDNYIPFNTLVIERELLQSLDPIFDPDLPFFEDWDLLLRLAAHTPFQHLARVTCEYRHFSGGGHHIFGESPRQRADFLDVKARVLAKHAAGLSPEQQADQLARAVDVLRSEAVQRGEEARTRGRELQDARADVAELRAALAHRDREYFQLEERYVRLNGEHDALQGEHKQLRQAFDGHASEIERLQTEEGRLNQELRDTYGDIERLSEELRGTYAEGERLRAAVQEQSEHLGRTYAEIERLQQAVSEQSEHLARTYAEIERLNALIRGMEGTRAWRLHSWLQRRKGGAT